MCIEQISCDTKSSAVLECCALCPIACATGRLTIPHGREATWKRPQAREQTASRSTASGRVEQTKTGRASGRTFFSTLMPFPVQACPHALLTSRISCAQTVETDKRPDLTALLPMLWNLKCFMISPTLGCLNAGLTMREYWWGLLMVCTCHLLTPHTVRSQACMYTCDTDDNGDSHWEHCGRRCRASEVRV